MFDLVYYSKGKTASQEIEYKTRLSDYRPRENANLFTEEKSNQLWSSMKNSSLPPSTPADHLPKTPAKSISEKYRPNNYFDLIGNPRLNREIAMWLANAKRGESCKPALFSGPPGSGKSSCARVLASMNRLRPYFINASCERSGPELLKKILDATKTKSSIEACKLCESGLKTAHKCFSKESLVILDEIDGVNLNEKNNAITFLIEKLFEAKSQSRNSKPIIFICNNVYQKGLAGLRKHCEHFKFRRDEESVLQRLKEIVERENVQLGENDLHKIAKNFDFDIRVILNFLDLGNANLKGSDLSLNLANFNDRFNDYFEYLNSLFFSNDKIKNSAYSDFLDGIFLNYLDLTKVQQSLTAVNKVLNTLILDYKNFHDFSKLKSSSLI